jgi:hypothetical protein
MFAAAGAAIGSRRPATHLQFAFHLQRFKLWKVFRWRFQPRRAACIEPRRLAGIGCASGAIEASAYRAQASNLAVNLQHGDHEDALHRSFVCVPLHKEYMRENPCADKPPGLDYFLRAGSPRKSLIF